MFMPLMVEQLCTLKMKNNFKSVVFKKDKSSYEVSLDKENFIKQAF